MCGTDTRQVLREIAGALLARFPDWHFDQVPGCGHMAPISHSDLVNPRWVSFLDEPAS
jgi:hypothetical protein